MVSVLKWGGIILAGLLGLLIIALIVIYFMSQSQLNKKVKVDVAAVAIPDDTASIDRGKYLVRSVLGCVDCHGANLSGEAVIKDPPIGRIIGTNLTTGTNGIGLDYNVRDWVRAIRHGIAKDGRRLLIMPSTAYAGLGDDDLGAVIAYIKSLPHEDSHEEGGAHLTPLGRMIFLTGGLGPFHADKIDAKPSITSPPRGVTKEYGRYLSDIGGCTDCHGKDLTGGDVAGAPPGTPTASNLARGSAAGWTRDQFAAALRTGATPEGKKMNSFMPWKTLSKMTDDDISALWTYIVSVQGRETAAAQ